MFTLAWTTDPHLNFLCDEDFFNFSDRVRALKAKALVLTGDIAEAPTLERSLTRLRTAVKIPIYYVLGNHDFYRGSVAATRATARRLAKAGVGITWLRDQVVTLDPTWGLVGVDGWGDGRLGNFDSTPVMLADPGMIHDYREAQASLIHSERLRLCRRFGDEEAAALRGPLFKALASFPKVLVLTHIPPFAGAAWHEGEPSDPNWLPWFTCKAVGDLLLEAAQAHPDKEIRVLCGHTHGSGQYAPLANLQVLTGAAEYYDAFVSELVC